MRELTGQRIAVYARYSTDKQNPRSVDDQLRICREHVERLGGTLDDELIFMDAAISGKSSQRPGFLALHEAVRAKRVDVVVTESIDRIGRDIANNAQTLKQFKSMGARLIAISDSYDSGQVGTKLLYTLKSAMGEEYLEALGQKTKRGMDGRFNAKLATGGRTYGYRTVPVDGGGARMEIDPAQAETVRTIFDLFISGHSVRAIALKLNQTGAKPARTAKWNNMTVRAMLRNEVYSGVVTFNRYRWVTDSETGKRSYVERPRSEWRRDERPALRIIDPVTWHETAARIGAVARAYKTGKRKTSEFPMSGLLTCGACGALLTINGGVTRYYACSAHRSGRGCTNTNAIQEPRIRRWFFETFRDAAGEASLLDELRAEWAAALGGQARAIRAELEQRRGALTRTMGQIRRLLEFIADGNDSDSTHAMIREKEDHADLQRAAIAKLEAATGSVPRIPSIEDVRAFLAALPDAVTLQPVKVREAVRAVLRGTVVCFPPDEAGDVRVRFELDLQALASAAAPQGSEAAVFAFASCGGPLLAKAKTRVVEAVLPRPA